MANGEHNGGAAEIKMGEKPALELPQLENSVNVLARSGGFDFLEAVVDGVDNLNPVRKAKRSIFLTDGTKKAQRSELKRKLQLWVSLLSENASVAEMADKSVQRADVAEK